VDALISLVGATEDGGTVETGLVGAEGMAGLPIIWGAEKSSCNAVVRHSGEAMRMCAGVFRREERHLPKLRELLMSYTNFSFGYASQIAVCNGLHTVGQRAATWLLTTRDRLARDDFHMTHELIASSLGVRRAGVSVEIKKFEHAGWLRLSRRQIIIVDERGLRAGACECHAIIKSEFEQHLDFCANSKPLRVHQAGRAV
jgi:CRP-like cAMP-binding protein